MKRWGGRLEARKFRLGGVEHWVSGVGHGGRRGYRGNMLVGFCGV